MKYCSRPFRFLHLDPGGEVRACGWTTSSLGNILEDGLEAVWNGDKANRVRESIKDGSFAFCEKNFCPYLANDSLPDISRENFSEIQNQQAPAFPPYEVLNGIRNIKSYDDLFIPEKLPVEFDFAYDKICNHICPTCRNSIFKPNEKEKKEIEDINDILKPCLKHAEYLDICGAGDVLSSPYMMDILKGLDCENENLIIDLETNGALFDEAHWNQISHISKYNLCVNFTSNSWERDAYTYLNGGVKDYDKLIENVNFVKSLRQQGKIKCLTLSMVIQDRNFRELPGFIKRSLEEFGADYVNLKPVYHWFCLAEEDFWFKDVANPLHPYYKDFKRILEDPVFKDDRVYWWDGFNVHVPKQHPAHKADYLAQMLLKFFNTPDYESKLKNIIQAKKFGRLGIYGAGDAGGVLCRVLKNIDEIPKMVIDKYRKESSFLDIPMINFLNFNPDDFDTIVITPVYYSSVIEADLKKLGYKGNILDLSDLIRDIK